MADTGHIVSNLLAAACFGVTGDSSVSWYLRRPRKRAAQNRSQRRRATNTRRRPWTAWKTGDSRQQPSHQLPAEAPVNASPGLCCQSNVPCVTIETFHSMSFTSIHVSIHSCLIIDLLHSMSSMSLMSKAPTVVNYDVPNMLQISPLFAYATTTPHPHYLNMKPPPVHRQPSTAYVGSGGVVVYR